MQNPKALILDEPTSVLTPQEAEQLFETLQRLKAEGRAVLYISHKLEEVKRLCDRATILRGSAKWSPPAIRAPRPPRSLAALDGRRADQRRAGGRGAPAAASRASSSTGLSAASPSPHGVSLKDVSLEVRAGEVVGIAGVAGNGQDELFACLSGELIADRPDAIYHRRPARSATSAFTVGARWRAVFVPEERLGHAAAPDFSLSENVVLTGHGTRRHDARRLHRRRSRARQGRPRSSRRSTCASPSATRSPAACRAAICRNSSSAARSSREPGVFVVNQPTWGVDALRRGGDPPGAARSRRRAAPRCW